MIGRVKLEDGYYLVEPDGQVIRKLLDSEVVGATLKDLGFSEEQGRPNRLRLEGDNIVTHEGKVVRPLYDGERVTLTESAARCPGTLGEVVRDILQEAQSTWNEEK